MGFAEDRKRLLREFPDAHCFSSCLESYLEVTLVKPFLPKDKDNNSQHHRKKKKDRGLAGIVQSCLGRRLDKTQCVTDWYIIF